MAVMCSEVGHFPSMLEAQAQQRAGYWAQWFMPVVSILKKQMQEDQEVQTMKLKSFCKAKAIVNLVKRKPAEWEKIFASIHLIYLIYKYFKYTKN